MPNGETMRDEKAQNGGDGISAMSIKIFSRFASGSEDGISFVCPSCKVRREINCDRIKLEREMVVWCIYCKQSWNVEGKERLGVTDLNPKQTFPLAS
jgi:hypothetical protein